MNDYVEDGDLEEVKRLYERRGYFTVAALKLAREYNHKDIEQYILEELLKKYTWDQILVFIDQ